MVSKTKYEPIDFVLFGTLGDLARRKLLPSLYQLDKANLLHEGTKVIGVARQTLTNTKYMKTVKENFVEFLGEDICEETWKRFSKRLDFVTVNMKEANDYKKLCEHVDPKTVMVCYFATPPSIFGDICKGMDAAGVIDESVRVVLEKPIGHDFASSQVINDQVAAFFSERQIYRIDL
jgi:glucose-6-phosphate 1-dehydrogenase